MICTTGTDRCRVLRRDEILPTWPRFSPDGSKVAYVRNGTVSQLMAFSVSDGKEWQLGATHWQCPPVWSSPNNVWAFEGSAGGYAWVEKELETGLRTGRRVQVTDSQSAVNDELECWPKRARCDVAILPQAAGGDGGNHVCPPPSVERTSPLSSAVAPGRVAKPFRRLGRELDRWRLRFHNAHPDNRRGSNKHSRERNPLEHGVPLWFRGCGFETDAPHPERRPDSGRATSAPWGKDLISRA
jgi:hypothetical protein